MTNKTTKSALLLSSMSLLLCFAMLLGTTFAWFTDSATSAGNIIKAGNLDVEMYYADGTKDPASVTWADASQGAIFNYNKWEPGYTEVKHIKISNVGSLALKYQLAIAAKDEVSELADVIDVYFVDPATQVDSRTALLDTYKVDTLREVLAGMPANASGKLEAGKSATVTIALKMQESAGNEYQNKSIGTDFSVILSATQLNSEADSFDSEYDKDATYSVSTVEDLQDAIESAADGDVIALGDDIKGNLDLVQKPNTKFVIDGNGNTIEGGITLDGKSATYTTAGVVIQNVNFKGDSVSVLGGADACIRLGDGTNTTRYTCNVTVKNCTFDVKDAVGIKSYTGGDKNLKIIGCTATARAHSLAQLKGIDGVLVENCTVNSVRGINLNNSNNVEIVNCTIDVDKYAVRFGESANTTVEDYAITDCTLSSDNVDGDATIVLRAGATNANLTLTNTTINGTIKMSGHENANIIIQ